MANVIGKQACVIIPPDVTNYGSLQEAQHAAVMAKNWYMTIAPHNPNAGVSTTASLHLCAGLENLEVLEHMSRDVLWGDEII
jgi:galactonate dehydratase